jgi:hypothetical protein
LDVEQLDQLFASLANATRNASMIHAFATGATSVTGR